MNAQDDHSDLTHEDTALLASIDRILTHPQSATDADPDSLERFCAHLAESTPQANPAYAQMLGRRLTDVIEQHRNRKGMRARLTSLVARPHTGRSFPGGPWQAARWRLASLIAALLVAAGALGAYLHGPTPTPVDAQTVLHRAEAVGPGPNAAMHETYRLAASGGLTGSADVWVGADAVGAPTQFALTQTMFENGRSAPDLSSRLVRTDQTFQVYDPSTNTVTESTQGSPLPDLLASSSLSATIQDLDGMYLGTLVAQKMGRALEVGAQQTAFTLQQQTLDGVPVYALHVVLPGGFGSQGAWSETMYFNAQSYLLEGTDWSQAGRTWQARLDPASYRTMPLSAVPPQTFTLNAPATARVVTLPAPAPKWGQPDDIMSTMATVCHTTSQALAAAARAGGKSMLAICQETNPGMTADQLVAAVMAPLKSSLDAQVASGAITAAQEAQDLANLRIKLTHMLTDTPDAGTGTKPGSGAKQP
ncbi:MAG: hypothetical protein JOZ41_21665 [Chloroflexi bacterium]|nr:hypothetical protein [Chloroflexota bacterium]